MSLPFIHLSRDEFKALLKETLIEVLAEHKPEMEDSSALMNIQQASAWLNLAVATLYEKTSTKSIPHYKQGKKIMFKKAELLEWIESHKVKTTTDVDRQALNHILRGRR
ncbi:MAG TPA: helix-turn-helix domain-containing protein [Ohtaekwangia sp.]